MATPHLVPYTDKPGCPRVFAVDDAWFEGGGHPPLFEYFDLGGVHLRSDGRTLTRLVRKLGSRPPLASGDAEYLKALASQCRKTNFELTLCNFEGLEANWTQLNAMHTAILLDLNYTYCSKSEVPEDYGLRLMHKLLRGRRPYADVFIVTGEPKTYYDTIERHALEASWWPIRGFPIVSKREPRRLRSDLECFASYFKQGTQRAPIVDLLSSLVRANSEGWSHPNSFDEVPDVPFRGDYGNDKSAIKALFHNQQSVNKYSDYPLMVSVVTSLLSTSAFLMLPADDQGSRYIRLPWAPFGALWVAMIWDFLYRLTDDKAATEKPGRLQINADDTVSMLVPLNSSLAGKFRAAWEGEGKGRAGTTCTALTALENREFPEQLLSRTNEEDRQHLRNYIERVSHKDTVNVVVTDNPPQITIRWKGIFL